MKRVILVGGLGTQLFEETHLKAKPMIEIGGKQIGFRPRWLFKQGIERTLDWYRAQAEGADAWVLCAKDIALCDAST